MQMMSESI